MSVKKCEDMRGILRTVAKESLVRSAARGAVAIFEGSCRYFLFWTPEEMNVIVWSGQR